MPPQGTQADGVNQPIPRTRASKSGVASPCRPAPGRVPGARPRPRSRPARSLPRSPADQAAAPSHRARAGKRRPLAGAALRRRGHQRRRCRSCGERSRAPLHGALVADRDRQEPHASGRPGICPAGPRSLPLATWQPRRAGGPLSIPALRRGAGAGEPTWHPQSGNGLTTDHSSLRRPCPRARPGGRHRRAERRPPHDRSARKLAALHGPPTRPLHPPRAEAAALPLRHPEGGFRRLI